ncbi:MAG TPA: TIGR03667 family PPOX class F420-dependent oxidoreductase [Ktedonobacterales bacterium]|nr:TIGR03667 family PPOX class F420-dependent oxidoreductase [Ktedonobacterales bacterium]
MTSVLPSPSTPFGERVERRLREERVIWLTTSSADGTPQPNPVWFLWDGSSVLIYSLPDAARIANLKRNPKVALHFDGNGKGGDIIIITGEARISQNDPPADQLPIYVEKYRDFIARSFGAPEAFAAKYSVALRITPTKIRGL